MRTVFLSATALFTLVIFATNTWAQENESKTFHPAQITFTPQVTPPKEAVESGLGGAVRVKILIDESGNVTSADDVTGPDHVCRQVDREDVVAMRNAAKEAALTAKFNPATEKGRPVASTTWLNFGFLGTEALPKYSGPPPTEAQKYTVLRSGEEDRDTALLRRKANTGSEAPSVANPVVEKEPAGSSRDMDAKPAIPKQIRTGVVNGKATSLPKPEYPAAARALRASGSVSVQILIDHEGNVFAAEAISGHPLLRSASAIAACDARFSPTRLSGHPVNVIGLVTYNFIP